MKRISLGLISLLVASIAQARPAPKTHAPLAPPKLDSSDQISGQWWMAMSADAFNEGDKDEAVVTGIKARGDLKYKLAPLSDIVASGEVRMYWGRVQNRYDDDLYDSSVRIREAYVNLKPIQALELRIGAHLQRDLSAKFLIAESRSFPGLKEILKWETSAQTLTFWAQQTIPTSYSMNARRSDREKMPSFLTETIAWEFRPSEDWDFKVWSSHYRYSNLPSVVAYESSVLGNIGAVVGDTPNNSRFITGFDGIMLGSEACWCGTQAIGLTGGYRFLRNFGDDGNLNQAQEVSLGAKVRTRDFDLTPKMSVFAIEGNVAPAVYTAFDYGRTNRQGFDIEVEVALNKYGFSIIGEYAQAEPIIKNEAQGSFRGFLIGLETKHADF